MKDQMDDTDLRQLVADLKAQNERLLDSFRQLFMRMAREGECRECHTAVYFVPHLNSSKKLNGDPVYGVYDADGMPHFASCKRPGVFRARQGGGVK